MNRKILLWGAALMTAVFVGCGKGPSELLLDSFEGELSHATVDYGEGGGATLAVSADTQQTHDGTQSIKLEYDLSDGGYFWAARGYRLDVPGAAVWTKVPEKIKWERYTGFSIWMWGTKSGGKVAFDIKDSGAEMWRFMIVDDFEGWKEVVMPFADFFARSDWQPYNAEKNGVIDFPVYSFQLEPRRPESGTYIFDQVSVVRK